MSMFLLITAATCIYDISLIHNYCVRASQQTKNYNISFVESNIILLLQYKNIHSKLEFHKMLNKAVLVVLCGHEAFEKI